MMLTHARRGCLALIALCATATPAHAEAQVADGQLLFRQRCSVCHSVAPGKVSPLAPNLAGVMGRRAGSAAFNYSPAMKASNIVWTRATLDKYLAAPSKTVVGTKMAIAVTDARQRGLLIDYLATVK
jgi:cytochrome c